MNIIRFYVSIKVLVVKYMGVNFVILRRVALFSILSTTIGVVMLCGQISVQMPDTIRKSNFWIAAAGVTGVNLTVWSVDRFALNHPWARSTGKSIINNIQTGFTWDTDALQVNMFDHPYHGSIYFNAARAAGLDYWHSIPLTAFGSFTWEFFAETEHASINDFISTTVGGMALGETFNRLSFAMWDESKTGFTRFSREFGGLLVNPAKGIVRLINGDAYRVRKKGYRGHIPSVPMSVSFRAGVKSMQISQNIRGRYEVFPTIALDIIYNDVFELSDNPKPFDYFRFWTQFNLSTNQPAVSNVHVAGLLTGAEIALKKNQQFYWGIFQHLSYSDSEAASKKNGFIPYKLGVPASFGVGLKYRYKSNGSKWEFGSSEHFNGVLLGGTLSDHFVNESRNYNFGSGFSLYSYNYAQYGKRIVFNLDAEFYRLYTWRGFDPHVDYSNIDPNQWNLQGDVSQTSFLILRPIVRINPYNHWSINLSASHYRRLTSYKYYENKRFDTYEFSAQVGYSF